MEVYGIACLSIVTGILVLSILSHWIESKAVDWWEGELVPHKKWVGIFRRYRTCPKGQFDGYAFVVRLPSYAWEQDICEDRFCWHQRVLYKQPWSGWRIGLHRV